jgi:hypothetical protein
VSRLPAKTCGIHAAAASKSVLVAARIRPHISIVILSFAWHPCAALSAVETGARHVVWTGSSAGDAEPLTEERSRMSTPGRRSRATDIRASP